MSEPKDEKIEDSKSTEENQESRKDFTKDDDGDEEIGCLGSHNKDLGMEKSEDKGRMSKSIAEEGEELKDDEVEIESLSRKKLEQIIESRETLITNNVAEVITLDGEDEDNVNKTIEPRDIIESENETYKGIKFFKVDLKMPLKMGRRDVVEGKSNDEVETGEIKEDEVEIIDSDKDKKEREDEKGSNRTRSPIDDDYEADPVCKEPEPNESSVKEPNAKPMARGDAETKAKIAALRESLKTTTTTPNLGSTSRTSTTEKESSPGTSLRLVSLANLVPNSPTSSSDQVEIPTGGSWTVAEVILFMNMNSMLFHYLYICFPPRVAPWIQNLVLLSVHLMSPPTLRYHRSKSPGKNTIFMISSLGHGHRSSNL